MTWIRSQGGTDLERGYGAVQPWILPATASIFAQILALKPPNLEIFGSQAPEFGNFQFTSPPPPLSEANISSQAPHFGNPGCTHGKPLPEKIEYPPELEDTNKNSLFPNFSSFQLYVFNLCNYVCFIASIANSVHKVSYTRLSVKIAIISNWNDCSIMGKCTIDLLLSGELRKYAKNSNFGNFESALYWTSGSMPLNFFWMSVLQQLI